MTTSPEIPDDSPPGCTPPGGEAVDGVGRRVPVRNPFAVRHPRDVPYGGDARPSAPGQGAADHVRALIRAQLRAALGTCAIVLIVMVGLPLLPVLAPWLGQARPHGIPLPWMGLAFAAQPVWVVLALWHVRRSERIERDFTHPPRDVQAALPKPCEPADRIGEGTHPVDGP